MSRFFNGAQIIAQATDVAALDVVTNFTVACFYKVTAKEATFSQSTLMSKWSDTAPSTNKSWLLDTQLPSGNVSFNIVATNGTGYGSSCAGSKLGVWNHAAATFDGSSVLAFCNGAQGNTVTAAVANTQNSPTVVTLGNRAAADATPCPLTGFLAHAAMWNVALTVTEIRALSRGVSPFLIRRASLAGYWPLEEPNGLADRSGNGNAMTVVTGPAAPSPDSPFLLERPRAFRRTNLPVVSGSISAPFIAGGTVVRTPTLSGAAVSPFDNASVSVSA